jgi:chromosome segregation ATPase
VEAELKASNHWAEQLNAELAERRARVGELQDELARDQEAARLMSQEYEAKIGELEQDIQSKIEWAHTVETNLTAEIRKQTAELVKAVEALDRTDQELKERTEWALRLQEEAAGLARQVELFRASRWVKLGHKVGLGPTMPNS